MFRYTSGVFLQSVSFRFAPRHFSNHGTRKTVRKTGRISVVWGLFLDNAFCSRMSSVVQFLGLQQGSAYGGGSSAYGGGSRRQVRIIKDVSCSRHSVYTSCSNAL